MAKIVTTGIYSPNCSGPTTLTADESHTTQSPVAITGTGLFLLRKGCVVEIDSSKTFDCYDLTDGIAATKPSTTKIWFGTCRTCGQRLSWHQDGSYGTLPSDFDVVEQA